MYKLSKHYLTNQITVIINLETGGHIPVEPANTDYQAYLKWLDEGNTPTPAEE
jgi:hypothetical protein